MKRRRQEGIVCLVSWVLVFLISAINLCLRAADDPDITFSWKELGSLWLQIMPYLCLFLVHRLLLVPYLLQKRRTVLYVLVVFLLLGGFYGAMRWDRLSEMKENPFHPRRELRMKERPPMPPHDDFLPERQKPPRRPMMFPSPELMKLLLALLMLGLDLAIKYFFKSQRDEETLRELERQNLQQELQYLKYQINPHFFMNTLNNIHALVDIDGEKAKNSILELSRLMRYILYEGANRLIPLNRETEFLNHYIALMRLRFTDKVKIEIKMPDRIPEVKIPPLLLISFVENAFKHGVSYRKDSFVRMSMNVEKGELLFHCINSRHEKKDDPYSGVGLENVRKRLSLLYGNDYTLSINRDTETFEVLLIIPVTI